MTLQIPVLDRVDELIAQFRADADKVIDIATYAVLDAMFYKTLFYGEERRHPARNPELRGAFMSFDPARLGAAMVDAINAKIQEAARDQANDEMEEGP